MKTTFGLKHEDSAVCLAIVLMKYVPTLLNPHPPLQTRGRSTPTQPCFIASRNLLVHFKSKSSS